LFFVAIGIRYMPLSWIRTLSPVGYIGILLLLIGVEFVGSVGMGAQRWIELGPLRLQPSELMKIALVMLLAAYYDWLDVKKVSHPLWVAIPVAIILVPTFLVLKQPDLGTAILLLAGGGIVMFVAGVSLWYFGTVIVLVVALIYAVFESRGTDWQLIEDYQFRRIDTFLDPSTDPLGAGYNITQAQIALGSGGWAGKGFMQGTQSRLNFLPEKHTDFIFTTLAEEFGFVGALALVLLYLALVARGFVIAMAAPSLASRLLAGAVSMIFFTYAFVNMGMVSGILPVVGVPLPFVSYGGTALVTLCLGLGILMSIQRSRSTMQT
jgi:rod shape determining protein RodA